MNDALAAHDRRPRFATVALIVAIVAISFAAIFFKKAAPTNPLVASGIRLALATLLLSPALARARRAGRLDGRVLRFAGLAGMFYALHFGSWVTSLTLTSVAASVTLVTATPLLLALLGLVTGRDRPDGRLWIALAMSVVGVTVIGWHDLGLSRDALVGDGLAFLGAIAMAGYFALARRVGPDLDPLAFGGVAAGVGAVCLLGTAAVTGVSLVPASWESFGFIVLCTLVPQLVGHTLLTWSLRHSRPMVVGLATVGEPVGASALGWLWLGERVAPIVALGSVITLLGVALAVTERRKPEAPR
ncbi:MAG: DMT family transporter [Deltaproteobacteria bacterium]|nr:DMT family transporter [Deltaproteobacteria bacterium]